MQAYRHEAATELSAIKQKIQQEAKLPAITITLSSHYLVFTVLKERTSYANTYAFITVYQNCPEILLVSGRHLSFFLVFFYNHLHLAK